MWFSPRVSSAAVALVLVGLELSPANEALRLAVTAAAAGAGAGAVQSALDPGGQSARERVLVMVGALSVFCFAQALALLVGIAEVSPALIGLGLATAAGVVLVARRSLQRMRASEVAACR